MNAVNKLLDNCRDAWAVDSDNALAKKLGVTRGAVSNWRNGRAFPDAVACGEIAEITGIALARVLGIVGEQRALSDQEKRVWRRLATTIALVFVFALPLLSEPVSALGNTHYANLLRWVALRRRRPNSRKHDQAMLHGIRRTLRPGCLESLRRHRRLERLAHARTTAHLTERRTHHAHQA